MTHGFTLSNCLRLALDSLGQTSEAIADSLRAKGCGGEPVSASHCPLANYIRRLLPGYPINVDEVVKITVPSRDACPHLGFGILAEFKLPAAHRAFISDFDDGAYPDLETREPTGAQNRPNRTPPRPAWPSVQRPSLHPLVCGTAGTPCSS
jgi:hypothetical protein